MMIVCYFCIMCLLWKLNFFLGWGFFAKNSELSVKHWRLVIRKGEWTWEYKFLATFISTQIDIWFLSGGNAWPGSQGNAPGHGPWASLLMHTYLLTWVCRAHRLGLTKHLKGQEDSHTICPCLPWHQTLDQTIVPGCGVKLWFPPRALEVVIVTWWPRTSHLSQRGKWQLQVIAAL